MQNTKINKILVFCIFLVVVTSFLIVHVYIKNKNKIILKNNNDKLISIKVQDENGDYIDSELTTWPTTDWYTFDKEASTCENGGEVNFENGQIVLNTNGSEKCTIYFKLKYKGDSRKVIEKALEKKDDVTCTANVYSPLVEIDDETYLSGDNECIDFNYVWYSGKLWRITQINSDGTMKMITQNAMTGLPFGATSDFENSWVYQWLNEDFLDTLYNADNILVKDAKWELSSWYDYEKGEIYKTVTSTVGLLNPFEYNISDRTIIMPNMSNYLVNNYTWWLSSRLNASETYVHLASYDNIIGATESNLIGSGVRPVVLLRSDVLLEGEGTKENPFTIVGDRETGKTNEKINTRLSGEYVNVLGKVYRIVSIEKDSEGNDITKITSLDYARDERNEIVKKNSTNPNENIHNYNDAFKSGNENYWGAYLNKTWLTEDLKKYLTTSTYYVNTIIGLDVFDRNYKNTICKDIDSIEPTKTCEKTENVFEGYVGLLRIGEMFVYPYDGDGANAQSMYILTSSDEGGYYPYMYVNYVYQFDSYGYTDPLAAKPVVTLKSDVYITKGDGKTPTTAYEVAVPTVP